MINTESGTLFILYMYGMHPIYLDRRLLNPSMALTASEFNESCSKFVEKYQDASKTPQSLEVTRNGYTGWRFISHPTWPAFSYMTRNTTARRVHSVSATAALEPWPEDGDLEEAMPSYILQQESKNEVLTVVQYIVYSPTFRVPAFYFLIYDQGKGISDSQLSNNISQLVLLLDLKRWCPRLCSSPAHCRGRPYMRLTSTWRTAIWTQRHRCSHSYHKGTTLFCKHAAGISILVKPNKRSRSY